MIKAILHLLSLLSSLILFACTQQTNLNTNNSDDLLTKSQEGAVVDSNATRESIPNSNFSTVHKPAYQSIQEVVEDKETCAWVNLENENASLAFYFNFENKNEVAVMYTHECWITFPFKANDQKITI